MEYGKLMPYSNNLEVEVLATIMNFAKEFHQVEDIFVPDNFYDDRHKSVANAIIQCKNKGVIPDSIAVIEQLKKAKRFEEIGGAPFMSHFFTGRGASIYNLEHNIRLVHQYAILRKIIFEASSISQKAFDPKADAFDLIEELEKLTSDLNRGIISEKIYDSKSLAIETSKIIQMRSEMEGVTGIESGFPAVDKATGGWEDGTMIVLAARPGMGKTALALQVAARPAIINKTPVGIFSIEMPRTQVYMRMMAQVSNVSINKISGKIKMNHYEIESLHTACQPLYDAPIFIDDTPALSIKLFKAKARKMVSKNGVELIIVDFLQLMDAESNTSREQQVSKISREIKATAKELNVPIIIISSLSRSVETRGNDKRPQLSDLRDSGAIESDADMVLFLFRPEYYGNEDFEGESSSGLAILTIAKHRGGELGDIKLKWEGYKTKFSNWGEFNFDTQPAPQQPNENFDKEKAPF